MNNISKRYISAKDKVAALVRLTTPIKERKKEEYMKKFKFNITKEEIAKVMYKTNFPDFEETENHNHKMYSHLAKAILDYIIWRLVND